ncbi:MAG: glycosyltransferase [Candidatus Omnitrophica bacterium]|nr:glycosyltransferase [Candidatus Omnitrophota bacterium]
MGTITIGHYEKFIGRNAVDELKILASRLKTSTIQFITTTEQSGSIAETLSRIVPLLNELGIKALWEAIEPDHDLTAIAKVFHDGLRGSAVHTTTDMFQKFMALDDDMMRKASIKGDIVLMYDVPALALVHKRHEHESKWVWNCHLDLSKPDPEIWHFLKGFIEEYDTACLVAPAFFQKIQIPQFFIPPSIDPFSEKNRPLSQTEITTVLKKYGLSRKKPMIVQIGRFDHFKGHEGVIEAYRMVKRYNDCQLVLASGKGKGDPDVDEVLGELREKAGDDPDIHILVMDPADIDVNALQQNAAVIVQKSVKEGFALTVTEALWKAKPVVASLVGGMPLQITHNYSGLLCRTDVGCATNIRRVLNNPGLAKKLGRNGREAVKKNFLSTRQLKDYMLLFLYLYYPGEVISLY